MFVVYPPPLADRVLFVYFSRFFMGGSGGRVSQSCRYFQKFFDHCHNKILMLQPLLLLNQAKRLNAPEPKRMSVISNKLI